ncbi:MAG: ROK family protein [Acidobacteriota bacterium]|nr:ROK family protein [Acidobacteriota bacterium]
MPTMRDVATLAGVSTATVSHFINNSRRLTPETHARVERAVAQIGFVPNPAGRLLAQQKSRGRVASLSTVKPDGMPSENTAPRHEQNHQQISPRPLVAAKPMLPFAQHAAAANTAAVNGASSGTTRHLLRIVRAAQPISRADLARRLNVNRSTVTDIVRPLLDAGVLREGAPEQAGAGRSGRPPIGLSLLAKRTTFIGVNIGVRRSQVGAALADGSTVVEETFDTPPDADAALAQVRATIETILADTPADQQIFIGVSVPSPTDGDGTRILYAPHLGWRDVRVSEALRGVKSGARTGPHSHLTIMVENDAMAAATYETRRRLRDSSPDGGWDDFILVRAGTGIGVGLVRGGEVYRGTGGGGLAGEFGHMTIVAGGKECACGNRGCWERYASATAAAALYGGDRAPVMNGTGPRFMDVVARAEGGERRAQSTLARVGEYLGIGIGNVISGLGVPRVVVSGRIVYGWKYLEEPLREMVARTMAGRLSNWSIVPGEPTGSGLGGALEVAIEQYLTMSNNSVREVA